jgi:uncharacterized protein (TIGR02246 family)
MEQKYATDPKTAEEIHTFVKDYEKGFNKNDPAAVAALCTEDAIQIGPEGPSFGRQAIGKKYANLFQQWHPTDIACTIDKVRAIGSVSWNSGGWTCTLQGENGPLTIKGYRLDVLVREGDLWKECISCSTPAAPEPK